MAEKVVIVGAGHGAGQLVASLRQRKFSGEVTLIGDEPSLPYQRPPLSKKYLSGELDASRLLVKPPSFYEENAVSLHLGTRVRSIDRGQMQAVTDSGRTHSYDTLVIATGSTPRRIGVPGANLEGVAYLRSITDVDAIRSSLRKGQQAAIVGAGYIGLEVAAVLTKMGIKVTIVEAMDRAMSRVVSPAISAFYESAHREHGVKFRFSAGVSGFLGEQRVAGVRLDNGDEIGAELVIVGIGIVPNVDLAANAGLDTNDGILVDSACRTSDQRVFAIGDCTRHPNSILGRDLRLESVQNALEQAKTAAGNICGEVLEYVQVPWFWSDQYDLKLQIAGLSQGYDRTVMRGHESQRALSCLYLKGNRLLAVDAINRPKDFMQAKALIAGRASIDIDRAQTDVELKDLAN